MENKLPKKIVYRKKKGFPAPVAYWINDELRQLVDELLDYKDIKREGLFNPDYIARLLGEHRSKKYNHRKKLWTLISFQLWKKHWLR